LSGQLKVAETRAKLRHKQGAKRRANFSTSSQARSAATRQSIRRFRFPNRWSNPKAAWIAAAFGLAMTRWGVSATFKCPVSAGGFGYENEKRNRGTPWHEKMKNAREKYK
jgi:hypothetical protein